MVKILILDHQYNVECLSALSSRYKELVFYQQDKNISVYDNYDLINPDIIILNEHFYKSEALRGISCSIIRYDIGDFIANSFVSAKIIKNPNPILIVQEKDCIDQKNIIYKNNYVKVLGISKFSEPIHHQYVGHIDSCKSLHSLINDYETILYTNKNICGICSHLKSYFGKFKSKGTISLQNHYNIITNIDVYEKYISNIL
jgi:hypothetical protein